MRKIIVVFAVALLIPGVSFANGDSAVSVVKQGLEAYSAGGAKAAIETWIKGSGLEGSKAAVAQANVMRQVEDFYGKYEGYDIVDDHKISERVHMVMFIINYNKGPLFARFQAYRAASGRWVATDFKFHTEAAEIWPAGFIFGK